MNAINDCECNEEEVSAECTGVCANVKRLREAERQELRNKLARAKDKRSDTNIDSEDSITSIATDDLEYLMRLEELMTFEDRAKQQLKELKRWENSHLKGLQTRGKVRSNDKNNEIDELRGQLEAKSLANQQLAGRVHELEGQVGTLKSKLQHCNEQVAQLTREQRDGASKLAEKRLDVDGDGQISGINTQKPAIKDKEVNAKPIIFDVSIESGLDKIGYQDAAVSAVVPKSSKNSQTPTESADHAVEEPTRTVIRKWSDDLETTFENLDRMIQGKENQSSKEVSGAQQIESFIEESDSVYQSLQKKVSKLDEAQKNDASLADSYLQETQQSENLNSFRKGDIYNEISFGEFRQVSQIIDSDFEETNDESIKKIKTDNRNVFKLHRKELELWLKNIFDVLLTIRICQSCSMMKGQMVEVCEAICYKLGIKLPNDDGKEEKANEIEMRELIEYQIQDVEASAGVIEKEISTIGNHSEELLTDQIDSTHPITAHSLIKKASELAKLQLSVKPIDSAIGTSIPSEKEPTKTHSDVQTGEEFIDSLGELSSLPSPVGTSTPIRTKRPEVIRSESLEKSLDLSRQPSNVVKNQETLSESPTRYENVDKVLKSTQTDYKSMESTNFQTKIDINKSVQLPRVSDDSQEKILSDPSGHIDQANSGAGRILTPEIKGTIKGEGEVIGYEDLSNTGISQDIQNLNNKSTTKMNSFESMQASNDKNVARDMEQKIDENKRTKGIKEDGDREIKGTNDDGKKENESLSEIIRGREKTQFLKKKNSTHDKEPITPRQSTSNSQEITKSSSIISETPHCICYAIPMSRKLYEQAIAAKKSHCLKAELLRNDRTHESQKAKRGRQENLTIPTASVETSTHHRDRSSSGYQPDFSCKPCDCSPCGSRIVSNEIEMRNQKSRSKNPPTVGDKKSRGVLAKIHTKSKR